MSYFKYYTPILESVHKRNKLNCLPINFKQCPKGFRILCMNPHILNSATSSIIPALLMTTLAGFIGAPLLPVFLASYGLVFLSPLTSQADARDFILVKQNSIEDFYTGKELFKVDVLAINDGIVIETCNKYYDNKSFDIKYMHPGGNDIVIDHGGFYSYYGHLLHNSIKVKKGDKVNKGQAVAKCGMTGNANNTPHLHFETIYFNNPEMLGIVKPLTGYEPYKAFHIPYDTDRMKDILQKYVNHPSKLDNSGRIGQFCYIDK